MALKEDTVLMPTACTPPHPFPITNTGSRLQLGGLLVWESTFFHASNPSPSFKVRQTQCGNAQDGRNYASTLPDYVQHVELEIDHTSQNAHFHFSATIDLGPSDESWGIKTFKVEVA